MRIVEAAKGKIGRTVRTFAEQLAQPAGRQREPAAASTSQRRRSIVGRETVALLAELLPKILIALTWQKTMRWGSGTGPWVRPVHGVVALFEGQVVPFELFGIQAGRESAGHSTLSPKSFPVKGVEDYLAALGRLGIVVFPAERKRLLLERMTARAAALGGVLVEDSSLLDKLAAICEIPGVMEGAFSADLCALPREVLATSLRDHQSALTVEKDGALLPVFLTVMDRPDDPAGRVRAGNEWVVAARLADAKFFFEKDRAVALADRREGLAKLTFQEKLGSYAEKSARLVALSATIAKAAGIADGASVAAAAELLKVDLGTDMVKEFTDLQGVVGGLYARAEGAPEPVWQAIYDQYRPAGAKDALPRGAVGQVTALADRLDTLAGFFGLGLIPTGSKDPFGLRRAALGVVRLALEGEVEVDLEAALGIAFGLLHEKLPVKGVVDGGAAVPSPNVRLAHDEGVRSIGRVPARPADACSRRARLRLRRGGCGDGGRRRPARLSAASRRERRRFRTRARSPASPSSLRPRSASPISPREVKPLPLLKLFVHWRPSVALRTGQRSVAQRDPGGEMKRDFAARTAQRGASSLRRWRPSSRT